MKNQKKVKSTRSIAHDETPVPKEQEETKTGNSHVQWEPYS